VNARERCVDPDEAIIVLDNIRLDFAADDQRPAVVCEDVEGLELSGLKARTLPGVEPVRRIETTRAGSRAEETAACAR
jgi:hypothetical protein